MQYEENINIFKTIFEKSNTPVLILQDNKLILCNETALEILGYQDCNEIASKELRELSPEFQENGLSSKTLAREYLQKAEDGERQQFHWIFRRKNGTILHTEIILSGFYENGKLYFQAAFHDISEKILLQKELMQSRELAEKSSSLKSNFLADISHDIRNPLNAILGFARILAEEEKLSEEERLHYGGLIQSNGKNLLRLINDIIDVSKIEGNQLKIEEVNFKLNGLMEDVYLSFQKQVKLRPNLKLQLITGVKDPNIIIKSDPERIRQILYNLLSNAIKYTSKGEIKFGYTLEEEKHIRFFVEDTGIGIAPEHLDFIFNRFSREQKPETKNIKGAGLGLNISTKLSNLLGGTLQAESTLGKGSIFYFKIPVKFLNYDHKFTASQNPKIGGAKSVDWSDYHILIADDDAINFELLRIILSKTRVKISKATNGQEAIDILERDNSINLMLLDIQMPVMNGYEAIKHIRRLKPDMPVIAQTAVNLEKQDDNSENTFNDCISKPIDVNTLIKTVGKYLAKD